MPLGELTLWKALERPFATPLQIVDNSLTSYNPGP